MPQHRGIRGANALSRKGIIVICVCAIMAAGVVLCWRSGGMKWLGQWVPGRQATAKDPLKPAVDAYNKGEYRQAEAAAQKIITANAGSNDPKKRRKSVEARYVLAFSAARRRDMAEARDRFGVLRQEAAKLPDKGKQTPLPGAARPTLEEEGAYQHAVCTAAMGDKKAAEAEYMAFIRNYPESPLTSAAVQRIERLHGGKQVPEAEAAWQKASQIARERQEARQKAMEKALSKCGPECLAEILRREGKPSTDTALANELKTTTQGTTLLAMVRVAKEHGLQAEGLSLTQKGLLKQPLPLIAMTQPGHYVVVEKATPEEVTIWDPSGQGIGKPGTRTYKMSDWLFQWTGTAMVVTDTTRP